MTMFDDTEKGRAGRAAMEAYLAVVPEPQPLDYPCSHCKAERGSACIRPDGSEAKVHACRVDRTTRPSQLRQFKAGWAGEYAYVVAAHRLQGLTGELVVEQQRSSVFKKYGEAYLTAKGWHQVRPGHWTSRESSEELPYREALVFVTRQGGAW